LCFRVEPIWADSQESTAARSFEQSRGQDMYQAVQLPAVGGDMAERQRQESLKMEAMGRLVSSVAHDFNNLLTGIMLYCDLLVAETGEDRLRRYVEEIRTAGEYGSALIQELMAVARQQVIEPRPLSINQVVLGLRNLLSRLVGENVELGTDLADDLGLVKIGPAQVQQVILNLVLNARDAMPAGGRITVATRNHTEVGVIVSDARPRPLAWVEFAVSDTGCGIDSLARSRMFEPFYTTKPAGEGNGLGLPTVRNVVLQAGGTIAVNSETHRGTQVVVRLPRVSGEASGPAVLCPQPSAREAPRGE